MATTTTRRRAPDGRRRQTERPTPRPIRTATIERTGAVSDDTLARYWTLFERDFYGFPLDRKARTRSSR